MQRHPAFEHLKVVFIDAALINVSALWLVALVVASRE
jgi:hypothetical protein